MTTHVPPKQAPTKKELREFALLVGGAFIVIGAVALIRHKQPLTYRSLMGVGAVLAVSGLIAPRVLAPVYAGWMRFAVLLSRVTTPIFMGIIYFGILTPIGLAMRIFGRHPLGTPQPTTAWVNRAVGERQSSLERQF